MIIVDDAQFLRSPISSVTPSVNAISVGTNAQISVVFNAPMHSSTTNGSTVYLFGAHSGEHNGSMFYNHEIHELFLTSKTKFIYGERVIYY